MGMMPEEFGGASPNRGNDPSDGVSASFGGGIRRSRFTVARDPNELAGLSEAPGVASRREGRARFERGRSCSVASVVSCPSGDADLETSSGPNRAGRPIPRFVPSSRTPIRPDASGPVRPVRTRDAPRGEASRRRRGRSALRGLKRPDRAVLTDPADRSRRSRLRSRRCSTTASSR